MGRASSSRTRSRVAVTLGYTPGVVTALTLNLPVDTYLWARAAGERIIGLRVAILATAVCTALLVAVIPLLFALGRLLSIAVR